MINSWEASMTTAARTDWQVDVDAAEAVHHSGFTVRFSVYAGQERLPYWIMTGIYGGRAWLGHPADVPGGLDEDEIHTLVRQGAIAFLEALEARGLG